MATLVCVPIMVMDGEGAIADATAARDVGADVVEFRIDQFFSGSAGEEGEREQEAVARLVSDSPLPCIVTCRPVAEGGQYDGDEQARVALFERLAVVAGPGEHPPRYIDIELSTFERSANVRQKIKLAVDHPEQLRDLRTSLILSMHDFQGRPADLLRRVARMRAEPAAAVHKIAYLARSVRDNLELFDLMREAERPTIALGMGRYGLLSRVLAPKFGGFLTFASLRAAGATAPGQPTVAELLGLYRFRSIKPSTRVYGVVGDPLEHSLSPAVHNAGFEAIGEWEDPPPAAGTRAGGVYLPLPVPAGYEHFKATVLALLDHPRLGFCGCSVTLPHKENLVRLAAEERSAGRAWEVSAESALCGAANTLVVERGRDGGVVRCVVENTDAPAAAVLLEAELGSEIKGKRVGIIGAGGVARAIACGMVREGASVVIFNRTRARAEALVEALRPLARETGERLGVRVEVTSQGMEAAPTSFCDALVNCTPVGMKGGPDPNGVPINMSEVAMVGGEVGGLPVVMDTVYNPVRTRLLEDARAAGFRTIDGVGMFVGQAMRQFRLWTGKSVTPADLFWKVATKALAATQSH